MRTCQDWDEAFSIEVMGGCGCAGEFEHGWVEIDVSRRDIAMGVGAGLGGPADDERHAGSSFVEASFSAAEWRVVGHVVGFFDSFASVAADTTVIAGEDEDGILG